MNGNLLLPAAMIVDLCLLSALRHCYSTNAHELMITDPDSNKKTKTSGPKLLTKYKLQGLKLWLLCLTSLFITCKDPRKLAIY